MSEMKKEIGRNINEIKEDIKNIQTEQMTMAKSQIKTLTIVERLEKSLDRLEKKVDK